MKFEFTSISVLLLLYCTLTPSYIASLASNRNVNRKASILLFERRLKSHVFT